MSQIELSVIVPFCNEAQNVVFTIQSLIEELDGFCKYEIIAIDNQSDWYINCSVKNERMSTDNTEWKTQWEDNRRKLSWYHIPCEAFVDDNTGCCPCVEKGTGKPCGQSPPKERPYTIRSRAFFQGPPGSKNDGGTIGTMFFRKGIVKYLQYDDKQGHWNAKNHGIEKSSGKFIFFVDAHCIMKRNSLRRMVEFLRNPPEEKIGGVHAYINYMLDSRSLEYRPQKDKFFGYQFCTHQSEEYYENGIRKLRFPTKPYKVCVMSTCGMMCPRTVIEDLGGWHKEFGIYCGGEGYMNFKQSTCGYHHWIHPEAVCWHWAEKRGYVWNHRNYVRNEMIAAYVCGGERALQFCVDGRGGNDALIELAEDVKVKCHEEREFVKGRQVEDLESYFDRWIATPGIWK